MPNGKRRSSYNDLNKCREWERAEERRRARERKAMRARLEARDREYLAWAGPNTQTRVRDIRLHDCSLTTSEAAVSGLRRWM